jgi:outer membrane murein-binding lipoprotein Lpp
MKTEITSKGVETKAAEKDSLDVKVDMFLKGLDVHAILSESANLVEAVKGLVEKVDALSQKVSALQEDVHALKEDDAKDDKEVEELSKKLDAVASKASAKTAAKKTD